MICCTLSYVHSGFAIILMRKRELVALLGLSSWYLVFVEWFFVAVPWVCLQFVIVVFPDRTHLLVQYLKTEDTWFSPFHPIPIDTISMESLFFYF